MTASPPGTIQLTWTPIAYVEDGGYYEVSYATAEAGPFTVAGVTADDPATTYTRDEPGARRRLFPAGAHLHAGALRPTEHAVVGLHAARNHDHRG